jgi:RecJ-like exonuclease
MNKKIMNPEKYGMMTCPSCNSQGYIQNPKRQCCPRCGGFGFIKKEAVQGTNISNDSECEISQGPNFSGC